MKALVNRPAMISTTTLQELGSQAHKKPKVEISLPPAHDAVWDSPVWANAASSNMQLVEPDKGQRKWLQSMFADLLHTAPTNTPFVFHDVHTTQSVCGNDLKPDIIMCLRDKPCVPLTTPAIIDLKQQGGRCDSNENVGKPITFGKAFLQQLPRSLRTTVMVGLTYLRSITLFPVKLELDVQGASCCLLTCPHNSLMSSAPFSSFSVATLKGGSWSYQILVQASKSWDFWGLERRATCMKLLKIVS